MGFVNYAFVDGSYNVKTKVYGYGGFLVTENNKYPLKGSGNDEKLSSMRNVAGEVLGAIEAMKKAMELKLDNLTIYYDYIGIENWALEKWKRNKSLTKAYNEYYNSIKDKINISFVKIKAHSNIEGNELADKMAKESVGIC